MTTNSSADAAVAEAMVALDKAEKQFAFYAEEHRKKGSEGKAATNYGYSLVCGRALEHLKLRFGDQHDH